MKIHEYQAKELLKGYGIPIQRAEDLWPPPEGWEDTTPKELD